MTSQIILICVCVWLAAISVQSSESKDDETVKIEYLHKKENCERLTKDGDEVHMHYTGTLTDGKQFDSSIGSDPLNFRLGSGQVIKGWDEGLLDMCVGEKRKLTIPPSKGYGSEGSGESIPPDSTLVFEVELMKISDGVEPSEDEPPTDDPMNQSPDGFFNNMDTDKDGKVTKEEFTVLLRDTEKGLGNDIAAAEQSGGDQEMIDQIFAQEDKNKDGFITLDEFLKDKRDEL